MEKIDSEKFFAGYRNRFGRVLSAQVEPIETVLGFLQDSAFGFGQAAYVLATIKHETADVYLPITEYGAVAYFSRYDADTRVGRQLGNTEPGDGFRFRGRGFVQITGRNNYAKFQTLLRLKLLEEPDLALDPETAWIILQEGMLRGLFTGLRLSSFVGGDRCNFVQARRVINGLDQADKIAGYARKFERILRAAVD